MIFCPWFVRGIRPGSAAGGVQDRHQAAARENAAVDVADGLAHAVGATTGAFCAPTQLLDLPLAFTQNALLSPDDFVKKAGERGVQLEPAHLLELRRRRGWGADVDRHRGPDHTIQRWRSHPVSAGNQDRPRNGASYIANTHVALGSLAQLRRRARRS